MQQATVAGEFGASRSGDFEALVRVYRPRVFRFILASVRSRETAENLTQDCFIRAYKAREHFRGDSNVGTWLTSIAANVVGNHESSQRLKFWRRALRPAAEEEPAQIDWVPDRQMSPEAMLEAKQQVAAIWKAAACLPQRQRTVFLLRFVEDMELLEIAAVTGMKEGTVKTHLFRALKTVRSAMEQIR